MRSRDPNDKAINKSWRATEKEADDPDEESGNQEALRSARAALKTITETLSAVTAAGEIDVDSLNALFINIKQAQKRGHLECLRHDAPEALLPLSARLTNLLTRLSSEIQSAKFDIACLNAEDLHIMFNGLAAAVGESAAYSVFFRADFGKLRKPLRHIIEALLGHASRKQMAQKDWDNTQLLNILNLLSRGLKLDLLQANSVVVRAFFSQALDLMKNWTPAAGECSGPTTPVAPLDTRQLGKCMVQLATVIKFSLVDAESCRALVRQLVLGMCGGKALDQCTRWMPAGPGTQISQASHGSQRQELVLTPIVPDGVEITNISNTIKECLHLGILSLGDSEVQTLVTKLCHLIQKIPFDSKQARSGQRLSNLCNFLREVFEAENANPAHRLRDRATFDTSCKTLLELIPQQAKVLASETNSGQAIVNMISFVKAMDRARIRPANLLRNAAMSLTTALDAVFQTIYAEDSLAGSLSGLQHFALRGLIPADTASSLIHRLFERLEPKTLSRWSAKSRAILMRGAVHGWPATPRVKEVMQTLFDVPAQIDDRFPYLKAACLLIDQDQNWLACHQSVLHRLLPDSRANVISLQDIQQAVAQLAAGEIRVDPLQEKEITAQPAPEKKAADVAVSRPPAQTAQSKAVTQRHIVGMTRLIVPPPAAAPAKPIVTVTTTTNTSFTGVTTTTTPSQRDAGAVRQLSPARAAQEKKIASPVLPASEPKLLVRQEARKEAAKEIKSAPAVTSSPQKKSAPVAPAAQKKTEVSQTKASANRTSADKVRAAKAGADKASADKARQTKASADKVSKKPVSLPPEREWFELLKQETPLSAAQIKRLTALLKDQPKLAALRDGKGNRAHSALFYAISTGKPKVVRKIAGMGGKEKIADTLREVFDETGMVGDKEVEALKAYLKLQSREDLEEFRKTFGNKYPAGDMEKIVAKRFLQVLDELQLLDYKTWHQGIAEEEHRIAQKVPANITTTAQTPEVLTIRKQERDAGLHPGSKSLSATPTSAAADASPAEVKPDDKMNALMYAAENNDTDMVALFLRMKMAKEQARALNSDGRNALMLAASVGHVEAVRMLLRMEGAADMVSVADNDGANALMLASLEDHPSVVAELLKTPTAYQQASAIDRDGENALMIAAGAGNEEVVALLLDTQSARAQAAAVNANGMNALMLAACEGNVEVVELLLDMDSADAQATAVNNRGANALILAAYEGHTAVVKLLLKLASAEAQSQAISFDSTHALLLAAGEGYADIVAELLKLKSAEFQVRVSNFDGTNALMYAALRNHPAVVAQLLKMSSAEEQARASNSRGLNALMFAAVHGHAAVAELLLQLKSAEQQAKARNIRGANALMLAAGEGNIDVVVQLIKMDSGDEQAMMIDNAGDNALISAAGLGHPGVVAWLLSMKSAEKQAIAINHDGENALIASTFEGHSAVVELLLELESADDQARAVDNIGQNALMLAAVEGRADLVEMLLAMRSAADQINVVNIEGETALGLAEEVGHADVVRLLRTFIARHSL